MQPTFLAGSSANTVVMNSPGLNGSLRLSNEPKISDERGFDEMTWAKTRIHTPLQVNQKMGSVLPGRS